uniref:Uncharacterized protein n=1 Tax=Fagus sylvatica TaxID=28930 RepID=A0A2N9G2J1_FAGSY
MGAYVVEFQGAKVKVSVVDDYAVVGPKIEELKSSFRSSQRLVGLDVNYAIQSCFLADETICFVGTGMSNMADFLNPWFTLVLPENQTDLGKLLHQHPLARVFFSTGVEVGHFASKILKKANIEKYGLAKLAGEVGNGYKGTNW